jgi:hypothetical protein
MPFDHVTKIEIINITNASITALKKFCGSGSENSVGDKRQALDDLQVEFMEAI